MRDETQSDAPGGRPWLMVGLAVLAVAIAVFIWQRFKTRDEPDTNGIDGVSSKARRDSEHSAWDALLRASPYRNVHPGVKYTSDAACAECHDEISAAYATHPMGRSLAPTAKASVIEQFTSAARNPLEIDSLVYKARRDTDRQFHEETRLSPAGEPALATEFEAAYAVGSGRTGRSYLIERDSHLFMSPMTWFAEHGWDLSPGYEVTNSHFNRPVVPECLFCHANAADHVVGTLNAYRPPIFKGHAIGCQRCHGPGELHVAARRADPTTDDRDETIVNPAHLSPVLRESVCQQCHLGGHVRVEARGRRREDFRPGLPWSAVEVVYLNADAETQRRDNAAADKARKDESTAAEAPDRFVGHVEQMYQSGCFVGSAGKLGCISCHDPHRLPEETAKVEFYRQRCFECHGEADCDLPRAERLTRQADDSCYACHMPRAATQIRHAAVTDHRIPRTPDAARQRPLPKPSPAWSPLVAFHSIPIGGDAKATSENAAAADFATVSDEDQHRNLAIALVMLLDRQRDQPDTGVLPRALPLLEEAVKSDPADVPARQAYALALGRDNQLPSALVQLEGVLRREPTRESALSAAASMLQHAQQWSAAAELWDRARNVNPWIVRYWADLAFCQSMLGRWDECMATSEEAIKRFPDSFAARQMLVTCLLVKRRLDDATREYERMLELNPPKPENLRRWWEEHPLRRQAPDRQSDKDN